jgi:hypothetical protein
MAACSLLELLRKYKQNEFNTHFEQKFATGSYGVGIGRAWCSWKACEMCSSFVQTKKMKKNKNSSCMLPKQQLTSFWSQGILGVKVQTQRRRRQQQQQQQHLKLGRQWKVIVFQMYFVNRRVCIFKTKNLYGNDTWK